MPRRAPIIPATDLRKRSPRHVGLVILNWNSGSTILESIASAVASHDADVRILIIDNGSTDGSLDLIRKTYPQVTVIANAHNVGVAEGFSQGAHWALEAGFSHLLYLNSDATIQPDCLAILYKAMLEGNRVGISTPRILDAKREGKIWFDGGRLNMFGYPIHDGYGVNCDRPAVTHEEDFATGCAMLVATSVFRTIGAFDASYFAYSEDADFSFRAKAAGFTLLHVPEAIAMHTPSVSIANNAGKWLRDYYVTRNALYLRKRYPLKSPTWSFLTYFGGKFLLALPLYYLMTGQLRRFIAVYEGWRDYLKGVQGGR